MNGDARPMSLAESLVLVDGPRADPEDVLFLALIELVVRGGLCVVPAPQGGTDGYALAPGEADGVRARPLVALVELVVEARKAAPQVAIEYAPTHFVNRRFAVHWGSVDGYVRLEVWSGLEDLGLLMTRPHGTSGFYQVYQWRLTPDGKRERDRLRAALSAVENWPQQPATSLLHLRGLAIPSDHVFDTVAAIEDFVIPTYERGDWGTALGLMPPW